MTVGADGSVSFRSRAFPRGWSDTGLGVSCATGRDCFVSVANVSGANSSGPAIEATRDNGLRWSPVSLPASLASVYLLSCPSPAGCIGVAFPASSNNQPGMIISNLP